MKRRGEEMKCAATFSPCRLHRFTLVREWDSTKPPFVVIGLNPSTADETTDDPTIRRCIGFAKREGCGSLVMLNVFSWRSTDPKPLYSMDWDTLTYGAHNCSVVHHATKTAHDCGGIIVAAWGTHGRLHGVSDFWKSLDVKVMCLGHTKDGHPKHPLYIKADQQLKMWQPGLKNNFETYEVKK